MTQFRSSLTEIAYRMTGGRIKDCDVISVYRDGNNVKPLSSAMTYPPVTSYDLPPPYNALTLNDYFFALSYDLRGDPLAR